LAELKPEVYSSLEALGICTIDAGGEANIPDLARLYRLLGKQTFSICDNQSDDVKALIEAEVELLLMHGEKGFESLILKNTTEVALKRFTKRIDWPPHLKAKYADAEAQASVALADYFGWAKANWGIADFLAQCSEAEIPQWLRDACVALRAASTPSSATSSNSDAVPSAAATGAATGTTADAAH
jgi:putative ATP-dependent endonuclease of OLD family